MGHGRGGPQRGTARHTNFAGSQPDQTLNRVSVTSDKSLCLVGLQFSQLQNENANNIDVVGSL